MSCGCGSYGPSSPAPNYAAWVAGSQNKLLPAVFDTTSQVIRPLAFGESYPTFAGGNACGCGKTYGTLEPTKALQDMYLDVVRRLTNLEQKYCECVCGPSTPSTPIPVSVPVPVPVPVPTLVPVADGNTFVTSVSFDNSTRNLTIQRNDGRTFIVNIPDAIGTPTTF